jgi:hypothetical protein
MYILFVWIYLKIIITTATATTNDYRQEFTKVWTAPIPNKSKNPEAESLIQEKWHLANNFVYGSNDVDFIPDPYISSEETTVPTVMRIKYGEGSYSPNGSSNTGHAGGVDFYSRPFGNHSYARALLQYDMAFDTSFDWMRGGKLPGLYGGKKKIIILLANCLALFVDHCFIDIPFPC